MNMFKNQSFRTSILFGFFKIIGLFAIIMIIGLISFDDIKHRVSELDRTVLPYALLAEHMAFDIVQVQQFLTDVSATHKREGYAEAERSAQSFKRSIIEFKNHFADNPIQLNEINALSIAFDRFYDDGKLMAYAYLNEGIESGNSIMEKFDKTAEQLTERMNTLKNIEVQKAQGNAHAIAESAHDTSLIMITTTLLVIILGSGVARWITQKLYSRLGIDPYYAKGIAQEIAAGNLTREIRLEQGDQSSLLAAMKTMQTNLRAMIQQVADNAAEIIQAANHLAKVSEQVSQSSGHQDQAAFSVSTAVEEMTANIAQLARNSEQSETLVIQAGEIADRGYIVVNDATTEMHKIAAIVSGSSQIISELGANSQQISEIVEVIKEIASLTNLLALNAAIEAARAGDQGRGFAVVAEEVRKLAERTTQSTQEVTAMISAIQQNACSAVESMEKGSKSVIDGVTKAQHAGGAMSKIKESTEGVITTVANMSIALKEQSNAVNQIAHDVTDIAQMVQHNNSAVLDVAQTSHTLKKMANNLQQTIGQFTV